MTDLTRKKTYQRLMACGGMLVLSAVLYGLSFLPDSAFFRAYTPWSKVMSGALGYWVSFVPFSLVELALYGLIGWLLYGLARVIARAVQRKDGVRPLLRYGLTLLTVVSAGIFWFTAVWGLQYRAPPLEERLGLSVGAYNQENLADLSRWLLDQINETAPLVPRDGDGAMEASFSELADMAVRAMNQLKRENDVFSGGMVTRPKRVTAAFLMDYTGIAGVYSPFTGECNVNPNMAAAFLPTTMAHEMAHRLGFAPENDASFVAFLACIGSEDAPLRYSAAVEAFNQCLSRVGDEALRCELLDGLTPYYNLEWARQTEKQEYVVPAIAEITQPIGGAVNDGYLKALGQEDGVQSYGRVVDLLLAWYGQGGWAPAG